MASIDIDYDAIDREVQDLDTRRKNWLNALRSEEYQQARGNLYLAPSYHTSEGFCCLGVGAHLLDSPRIKEDVERGHSSNTSEDYDLVYDQYELPKAIKDYLMGMNDTGTVYRRLSNGSEKRIRMGTIPQRDFNFIARWLEIVFALQKMEAK